MKYAEQQLLDAHRHSTRNRDEIERSQQCGCFNCCEIYDATDVVEYVDNGETALCPHCGVDSVIGDASSCNISTNLLKAMRDRWF